MANTIRIKRRSSSGSAGVSGVTAYNGELLYNEADNILYYGYGDAGGGIASSIQAIAGTGSFATLGTTQTISGAKTFSAATTFSNSVTFTNTSLTFPSGFTLPVNRGGTGAEAASGANSDITSITGLTTALSVAQGGTGSTTASGARSALSAAASGANSDITSLSGLTTAITVAQGGTGATTAAAARTNLLPSFTGAGGKYLAVNSGATDIEYVTATSGTVTSVAMTVPTSVLSVSGTPVTTSGTLAVSLQNQSANTIFAGPTTGTATTPTFRALVAADIPSLSYLSSSGGTVSGNVVVTGNLTVQGTTTTVSSTTLTVADKNIELATGSTTDAAADGGGLTLHGSTDKTFNWVDSTDSWTSSEHIDLASGKAFKINGTTVLSATALDGVSVDGGTF
ncbi:hypothetical protein EBT31_10860 [bacterium]|nr:hypothetical protein [bacterium]